MYNNIIIILFIIAIIATHLLNKRSATLTLAVCYTFLAPVLVLGERRMNSNYVLTLTLVLLLIYDFLKNRVCSYPRRQFAVYGGSMLIVLFMMSLGFLLHGTAGLSAFVLAMVGHLNIIVLTLALTIYGYRLSSQQLVHTAGTTVLVFIVSQALMILFQKLFFEPAYHLTWYAYASDSHYGPLRNMIVTWLPPYFYRAFGTFYSPTILGMLALLMTVVLSVLSLRQRNTRSARILMLAALATGIIGAFALTKSFMLGILVFAAYILVLGIIFAENKRKLMKQWVQLPVLIVISLSLAFFIVPEAGKPNRNYYYSFILNPLSAFDSRFQTTDPPLETSDDPANGFKPPSEGVDPSEDEGVLADAMDVIREHWLTGVGPVAIRGEFTGDSEALKVMHDGGIIAVLAYLLCYGYFFWRAWKHRLAINLVAIPVLALGSVVLNFLTINTSPVIIAAILLCDDVERRGQLLTLEGAETATPPTAHSRGSM